jgi:DNA-3-methyladenine glycosylase II
VVQATLAAAAGPIVLEALREQVADWLAVDGDRATLSSALAADERLSAALRPVAGLPLLRTPTALEALVNTVIEQHIAWRMALKAQRWLVTWHNVALSAQEHTFYAYPSPEHLAAARPEDLLPLKITRRRVQVILHLARLCAAGELAAGALRQADEAAAYARLCALPGIGHWSAAVALLRLRGAGSFIPHTDVALQAAAARYVFGRAERLPPREVVALLRPLAGQAGAAVAGLLARYVLEDYGVAPER